MTIKDSKIRRVSIVFLGDFNTKIFQPSWFAREKLIKNEEADKADIVIIHPEITNFNLDWLKFEVRPNRLFMGTEKDPFHEPLKDLAIGTFKLLRHTPIRSMGINVDVHFDSKSKELWHAYGDKITPKEIWQDILKKPGLLNVTIESQRTDDYKGIIVVRIGPSPERRPGVYIFVNNHFEKKDQDSKGCEEIMDIFKKSWSKSLKDSAKIITTLWDKRNEHTA